MSRSTVDAQYTMKGIQEMLGLSRTIVAGLVSAGFVTPSRGPRREQRFSFGDMVLLRTAYELQKASIPPRKILRSLSKLREALPAELPLSGLRITAVGAEVAVRDRSGSLQAESGQLLMDFEVANVEGTVAFLQAPRANPAESKQDWFTLAEALERSDPSAAEDAYRRSIELEPLRADAYLNLGALMCESGRSDEAVALYERALARIEGEPWIHFNHGVALEDQNRARDALRAYECALALDDAFADAHYNAGVLLEKLGDARGALRHFSAYRRLRRDSSL